jgi:hypothetical protein
MYQMLQYDERMERLLEQVASTAPEAAGSLLAVWEAEEVSLEEQYLALALSSARWIDHRGPFIGHGTLNMAPVLAASQMLDERYQKLGLLQATVYVLDLFRNPNYGPYIMPVTEGVMRETADATRKELLERVPSGSHAHLSENLFVGLYRQTNGDVRVPLLQLGLQEYPHNEHKLLIVLRTLDLLDRGDNWKYGESLLRSAVQYLAALPKLPEPWQHVQNAVQTNGLETADREFKLEGRVDDQQVTELLAELLACEAGQEADLLARELAAGTNTRTLYEVIAQLSAVMLMKAPYNEEHTVTGILCTLDMMRDEHLPAELRLTSMLMALASDRTRYFKSVRDTWLEMVEVPAVPTVELSDDEILDQIEKACQEDETGDTATQLSAQYVIAGRDLHKLAQRLMQLVLTTQGPFMAIHLVKMIWGQLKETELSTSDTRWVHLASAARFAARTFQRGSKNAERIVKQWQQVCPS